MAQEGVTVPHDLQVQIAKYIEDHGVLETTRRLKIARETLIRLRAGDRLREGTILVVRQRLAALKKEEGSR
jgi:hypothetical protein